MKLYAHQETAVDFLINKGSGALWLDVGLGKTLIALEYFKYVGGKMLVIAPLSLLEAAWRKDVEKFTSFSFHNLHKRFSFPDVDIYVINYESLLNRKKMISIADWASENKPMCVLDESSRVKNHLAKTTKNILELREFFPVRVVMSATPAPNTETEYFPQMEFVKPGILGKNFYKFRNTYFALCRGGEEIGQGMKINSRVMQDMFRKGFKYKLVKRETFYREITPYLIRAKREDCLDLPEATDEFREVILSPEGERMYRQMKNDLITERKGKTISVQHAISKLMKLRQITSGFLINEYGEAIDAKTNPKLEELKQTLLEIGSEQVIIWCTFRREIERIMEMLGDRAVSLYGATKDKNAPVKAFIDGSAQYLVAHGRSAGHGLTFVNCSVQIFYSLDFSYEIYEQSKGRIMRIGQKRSCVYIHLLTKDSAGKDLIDDYILKVLKRKGDNQSLLEEFCRQ